MLWWNLLLWYITLTSVGSSIFIINCSPLLENIFYNIFATILCGKYTLNNACKVLLKFTYNKCISSLKNSISKSKWYRKGSWYMSYNVFLLHHVTDRYILIVIFRHPFIQFDTQDHFDEKVAQLALTVKVNSR